MEIGQMIRIGVASRYGRTVSFIARLVLGGLFIFAGTAKIYDPGTFAVELDRYQLIPWKICVTIAYYLPWVEFLAGLSLFLKSFERGALLLITLLLSVFTLALASAMVRGLTGWLRSGGISPCLKDRGPCWQLPMLVACVLWSVQTFLGECHAA